MMCATPSYEPAAQGKVVATQNTGREGLCDPHIFRRRGSCRLKMLRETQSTFVDLRLPRRMRYLSETPDWATTSTALAASTKPNPESKSKPWGCAML
jgi:hypothetical protein